MRLLFNLIKEKKVPIILCVILAALGSILLIVPYALIFNIVDYYIQNGIAASAQPVIRLLGIALGAVVLRYLLIVSSFVFSHIAAFDLLYKIRVRITKHIGKLPMGFWGKKNSGQMLKIVQDDVESIETFVAHHFPDIASGFALPIVILVYLFTIDWRLALAAAIPLPLSLLLSYMMWNGILTGQNRADITMKYHKAIEGMHSNMIQFVQGMPVVKVFNMTVDSFKKLKQAVLTYLDIVILWSKGVSPYRAIMKTIVLGGGIFILPLGIYYLETGSLDVSTFILFMLLGTGCCKGLVNLMYMISRMEMITAGIKRINDVLTTEPLYEPETPVIPKDYTIELKNVGFRYNEDDPSVLNDINVTLPQDTFTALVGPSGAGKTTLINLIARMWEVTEGDICIGGATLKEMGTKGVTETVGTVFQDVQMLTNTVSANIRMGDTKATQQDIEKAAKAAACHDFIQQLPKGYDTIIGDGGEVHLSGGEKQRIALARVILKDTPVILLDEATAYADAENETIMQEAVSRLMVNKTVIVIAHRLSTIIEADNILVIDKGRVAESGTHQELLNKKGVYQKMWKAHTRSREWSLTKKEALV